MVSEVKEVSHNKDFKIQKKKQGRLTEGSLEQNLVKKRKIWRNDI